MGKPKVARLVELFKKYKGIRIIVDSKIRASGIETALAESGIKGRIDVLVDVDVGLNRTGVAPQNTLTLAKYIATLPHLYLISVQGYKGYL